MWGIADGSAHDPQGRTILALADVSALESAVFTQNGAYDYEFAQEIISDIRPYALNRCAGRESHFSETEYELVVATALDGGAQDCWSINSNHQLRHLSRIDDN